MRKVELNMNEDRKYRVIKKLAESGGSKDRAATKLNCSKRHINRMIAGYKNHGKSYFVHGNKNRKPFIALGDEKRKMITDLYLLKYFDTNFEHFTELIAEHEGISVSPNTARALLLAHNIVSPLATKATRKAVLKNLSKQLDSAKSKKKKSKLQKEILALEDPHPRRPRCAYSGEILQMDASKHKWFLNQDTHLHVAIDDATGTLTGAYITEQETLHAYYQVIAQTLLNYGIPYSLLTDRRTVFEYKRTNDKRIEKDTNTQFSYACSQLGIEINTTSVPQAKGRVERVFGTLNSRLPVEMRLAGVASIDEANEFLKSYLKKFNDHFALQFDTIKSVFEKQPDAKTINLTLAILSKRKIDHGHCINYKKRIYVPVNSNNSPFYFGKGTDVVVIKALDGRLFTAINEKVYALAEIPVRNALSPNFDMIPFEEEHKRKYVPPMSHPWKAGNIDSYFEKTQRVYEQSFIDVSYSEASVNL